MLRWTLYILRSLANLLADPVDATLCQVCEGGGRKEGARCQPVVSASSSHIWSPWINTHAGHIDRARAEFSGVRAAAHGQVFVDGF